MSFAAMARSQRIGICLSAVGVHYGDRPDPASQDRPPFHPQRQSSSRPGARTFLRVLADDLADELADGQKVTGEIRPQEEPLRPSIMFTSLLVAKGLSVAHVFVVGMCNCHFPRDTTPSTFLEWVSGQTTAPVWINKDNVPAQAGR